MRQIEFITTAVAELFFSKHSSRYEIHSEIRQIESDLLYVLLCKLLDDKNINGAEDLLFDMLDADNIEHLSIATEFYDRVNRMTDVELQYADFSRKEIEYGLREVNAIYAIGDIGCQKLVKQGTRTRNKCRGVCSAFFSFTVL